MDGKSKILVVDDEDVFRMSLSTELLKEGYQVATAGDGDEALRIIQDDNIDFVLLDIKMSKVDGFEVLQFVKKNYPSVKVIMLTAYADLKHALASKKFGADDFMSKPFDFLDLLSTIERVLSK